MSEYELIKAQTKEELLESLYKYAAACHVLNISAEYPVEDDSDPEFFLPPEFDRKMRKLIERLCRKGNTG